MGPSLRPYQLTKGCCGLSLVIVPYCPVAVVPQGSPHLFPAPFVILQYLSENSFFVPVSVLCRFLCAATLPDLIPTSAMLRPPSMMERGRFFMPCGPIRELQRPVSPDTGQRGKARSAALSGLYGSGGKQREAAGICLGLSAVTYSGNTWDKSMVQSSRTFTRSLSPAAPKSLAVYRPSSRTKTCTVLSPGSTIQYSRTPARW